MSKKIWSRRTNWAVSTNKSDSASSLHTVYSNAEVYRSPWWSKYRKSYCLISVWKLAHLAKHSLLQFWNSYTHVLIPLGINTFEYAVCSLRTTVQISQVVLEPAVEQVFTDSDLDLYIKRSPGPSPGFYQGFCPHLFRYAQVSHRKNYKKPIRKNW